MPLRIAEPVGGVNEKPPPSSAPVVLHCITAPVWLTNSVSVVRSWQMPTGLDTDNGRVQPPRQLPSLSVCSTTPPLLSTSHNESDVESYVMSFGLTSDGVQPVVAKVLSGLPSRSKRCTLCGLLNAITKMSRVVSSCATPM